jgi:hypothetical protein
MGGTNQNSTAQQPSFAKMTVELLRRELERVE